MSDLFYGTAAREGRWWLVEVKGIGATQSRSLAGAHRAAVGLISAVRDVDESRVDVVIKPLLEEALEKQVRRAREAIHVLESQQREAAMQSREVARRLKSAGLTGADAAIVLGVSPQRVSQLLGPVRARPASKHKAAPTSTSVG